MKEWLISNLGSRIQGSIVLLKWEVNQDGTFGFFTIDIDDMLNNLYVTYDETGGIVGTDIPATGSYENLLAGDPDGAKGYRPIFEQWHVEGLV